uniref:Vacuolar protein sorting-associated protein 13D n=2 Tax=Macrostomum lignano TaxID=282301 RepID=A0A1I8IRW7_9PLAT
MLEGVISYILQKYVGKYVENFNSEKVSFGVFQGDVTLENLPLKSDALLDIFDLPVEIVSGHIGKISLKIPYTQLRSQPWLFTIEKLYIVAKPLIHKKYDERKETLGELERKRKQLQALEARWIKSQGLAAASEGDSGEGGGGYGSSLLSYGASLAMSVVENIQLIVRDVHIRYEDAQTLPDGRTFACGISLKELRAQSTDSNWVPRAASSSAATPDSGNQKSSSEIAYKLLNLSELCLYLDLDAPLLMSELSPGAGFDAAAAGLAAGGSAAKHDYLLRPTSLTARLKRYTTPLPLRSRQTPRIQLDVQQEELAFTLADSQYACMVALLNELDRFHRSRRHRKYRPRVRVAGHAATWWRFAIQAHLRDIRQRRENWSWPYLRDRCRELVQYVRCYQSKLLQDKLSPEAAKFLTNAEAVWSTGELLVVRELAMDRAVRARRDRIERTGLDPLASLIKQQQAAAVPDDPAAGQGGQAQSHGAASPASRSSWGYWGSWLTWASGYSTDPVAAVTAAAPEADPMMDDDDNDNAPVLVQQPTSVTSQQKQQQQQQPLGLTDKEQAELVEAFSLDQDSDTLMKRDPVFIRLSFQLEACTLTLMRAAS